MDDKIKRIDWIDYGKGICMVMVMISHLEICPISLRNFFLPFFLTGFFLLSGYVYKETENYKTLLLKKAKSILIPWFFLSIIEVTEMFIFGKNKMPFYKYFFYAVIQIKGLNEPLWYLPCLFISFIPFYFLNKKYDIKKSILIQFILCTLSTIYLMYMNPNLLPWKTIALPWHIQICFIASFFMTIGYYLKDFNGLIDKMKKINIVYVILAILLYFIFTNIVGGYGISDFVNNNIILWYITKIFGIMLLLIVSVKIKKSKLLLFVGKNSLLYYGLHFTIIRIINNLIKILYMQDIISSNVFIEYIVTIAIAMIIALILIIPINIINKRMKFIIGKF